MKVPFFKPQAAAIQSDAVAEHSEPPKTVKPRRVLPIHPVFFAVFPVLALFARNIDQAPLSQAIRPLGMSLFVAAALWAVLTLITRHARKAAVAASALVLAYSSYGHLVDVIPRAFGWMIAPVCVLCVGAVLFALVKTRAPLFDLTSALNLASVILLAPSCWTVGVSLWRASQPGEHLGEHVAVIAQTEKKHVPSRLRPHGVPASIAPDSDRFPDIYYIILDAYGRADTLKTFYGYDNTPFLRELERRGFYIASHSRANYDQTPLCLASALNFSYLDALAKKVGPEGSLEACRQMLDDNQTAAYLNRRGYHYVYIGSGVSEAKVETADLTLNDLPDVPEFEDQAMFMMRPGVQTPEQLARYDQHRKRLIGAFDNLNTVPRLPYQKFVFTHVLAPHPPFVLGANGEAIYPKGPLSFSDGSWLVGSISYQQYIIGYIAQMQYINKRTLEAIDRILKQSRRPPIIIVQGDHGSRMNLDWDSLEKTELQEPFSPLNAYFVPKNVRNDLYDTITPVNSFRIILSDVFGAKLPLLPDRSFYSTAGAPYGFVDVTERLARPRNTGRAATRNSPRQGRSGVAQ